MENLKSGCAVFGTYAKCTCMLVIEACILPLMLGMAADVLSLRAFKTSLNERVQSCTKLTNLAPCFVVHWLLGE